MSTVDFLVEKHMKIDCCNATMHRHMKAAKQNVNIPSEKCANLFFVFFFENPWSDRTPLRTKIVHTSSARVKKLKNDQYFIRGPSIFENRVPMLHGKLFFLILAGDL